MGEKKKKVAAVWFFLKRSLRCKPESLDVYIPTNKKQVTTKSNIKRPPTCSPRSIANTDFLSNTTSTCDLNITCHKGRHHFTKCQLLQSHHLSNHAADRVVVKVHDTQRTLSRFEDYRESVKAKASKLPKKHPRCLADGNELLRFHGTTLACSLGLNGSSSLCVSDKCCVCRIIREGFSTIGWVGVFTASTSERAFESIEMQGEDPCVRKALIVCRVVAGTVHRPLENIEDIVGKTGFDSLAGKVGLYSNIEELYLLNHKALLPCFVVICKT